MGEKDIIIAITETWIVTLPMLEFVWLGVAAVLAFIAIAWCVYEDPTDWELWFDLPLFCILWPVAIAAILFFGPPFTIGWVLRKLFQKENNYA